jgi:hypothetical protein
MIQSAVPYHVHATAETVYTLYKHATRAEPNAPLNPSLYMVSKLILLHQEHVIFVLLSGVQHHEPCGRQETHKR